jgi:hypothetical protein
LIYFREILLLEISKTVNDNVAKKSFIPPADKPSEKFRYFKWLFGVIKDWSAIALVIFLGGLGINLFQGIYWMFTGQPKCLAYKTVKQVGGCDAFGECGVEFTDFTSGKASKPYRGQIICVKKDWFLNFN